MTRISTFSQSNQLIQTNLRIQGNYAETQLQISTGLISDTYEGISDDANQLLNLESDFDELSTRNDNAQVAADRTEFMFDLLGGVIDVAQGYLSDLGAALTGLSVTGDQIQQSADAALEQIVGVLNSQIGDRFIFSGSDISTRPIDLTTYGGATIPSTADTSYYQGNTYISSVEVTEGFTVNYGVTADDGAIEQLLRSLDLVITNPNDPATLEEGMILLEQSLDDLATVKAGVAQDSNALAEVIDRNNEELNLIDGVISGLTKVDLASASVNLQQIETQLEASYAVTTRLLDLSILNYIR